ncbi:DNA cytosine methyltransferase [Streptomyces goshikiensis]|uniref:DNA cytosine methyltransferase n=1 Tax=Streptomyces goshikiensis TaxID=1942 RepID=UPI0036D07830
MSTDLITADSQHIPANSDAGQPEAATKSPAAAQLLTALTDGESVAPVSFLDRPEPAAGWVLTTAAGHSFGIRPVTYRRPDEDQWEAGHGADGSYWWAVNIEDRPLAKVLARIREDSITRTHAERNKVAAALVSATTSSSSAQPAEVAGEDDSATRVAKVRRPVWVQDTFAALQRAPLTYDDLDGWTYTEFLAAHPSKEDAADLLRLAGPGPVRWLFAPAEGDAPRAVNLFGGCGGWCVGIRRILGATVDMLCIDISRDATATATRAGCYALCADVRSIDPEHPVFRHTQIIIGSSPCVDFTNAGKRGGRLPENVAILADAIEQVGAAVGNYVWEPHCTCLDVEEECSCDLEGLEHFGPRSGATWDEIRAQVADLPGATTAGLMLEPIIWVLALKHAGAPLHTILIEQSNQLPEEIRHAITDELYCAGESELGAAVSVTWEEIDAAAYGSPSNRRRAFLMATFGRFASSPRAPGITITADQATGLTPDLEVITRGARKTSGGNAYVMGRVIPGVTSRIRSVDVGYKGGRFTLEQVAALVTLPRDYAGLAEGSRTSVCQQFADIVAPVVSAAVFGEVVGHLFGITRNRGGWLPLLLAYLREQYPGAKAVPGPEPSTARRLETEEGARLQGVARAPAAVVPAPPPAAACSLRTGALSV